MTIENLEDWKKAGQIAAKAREYGRKLIKPGVKLLDVAEQIEQKIQDLGGFPAFPVNIGMNDIAAHYTPARNEETVFSDQLVKLDVGAHVNGAIGDTACTVDLSGKYDDLVKASEEALDAAIKIVKEGTTLGEIGATIQNAIKAKGFLPISNLSGHGLELYETHVYPTIPNIDTGDDTELCEDDIIAIEPFATNGQGAIKESHHAEIFAIINERNVRSSYARDVLREALVFEGMPFAKRWIKAKGVELGMRELVRNKIAKEYPPLPEMGGGMISQTEHSLIVRKKDCLVLTKLKE
ncbi:type II methionyl aminopeptidase [Candidatus Woesearchaeota archaeon]|nr:type II methionyl aminopeptidase [Candidatus Woesearchaeota archaeon]